MLRDRLVLGSRDKAAQARLFREKDCDLHRAIESLRISERTQQQLRSISGTEEDIHAINSAKKGLQRSSSKKPQREATRKQMMCNYCGGHHRPDKLVCPAYGKLCRYCNKPNHFQSMCRLNQQKQQSRQQVHQVTEEQEEDSDESVYQVEYIGALHHNEGKKFFIPLHILDESGDATIKCQLDTGATCNVMSFNDLCAIKQHGDPQLASTTAKLKLYDNSFLSVQGECNLLCEVNGKRHKLNFKIISGTQKPLLSGEACKQLGLITINEIHQVGTLREKPDALLEEYADVFEGLGCLPGEYHIEIDPTVPAVQHAPRRAPIALKAKLKEKITELENKGIITKVVEPTAWISSLVTVVKPEKLRICIDPRDLNKAIKRPKYQIPTLDDILPQLAKARVYTVVDAKDGFHQVQLDKPSSYLTTFWTPFGRYRYQRMPFGISSAPEEFQRRMHLIVQDLPGVEVIADDILIYGCGETAEQYMQDHDANLKRLLQRAREQNLKLNRKKVKLRLDTVSYMGHLLTSEGLRPDPMKVRAITEMPQPRDKKAVERLLGCVNYLSRYLPKLAEVVAPLRKLTEKSTSFYWQSQQQQSFEQVKKLVTTTPVLKFYQAEEEVTIQCDASEKGLGATLLQNGQPVTFASRALSKTEQAYAQIEKECMSILFACERFDHYLHGRPLITVMTDHKPLVPIFTKSLFGAPKRLQRMLLRLQKYNLLVKFCPGSKMYIADMLSRAYLADAGKQKLTQYDIFQLQQEDQVFKDIEGINQIAHVRISDTTQQEVRKHTHADDTLQTLLTTILTGWPAKKDEVPVCIHAYWGYRDEITAQNGILFKGPRVIVPQSLRTKMLARTHSSHQGAEACVRRARDVIFWPGMTAEIKEMANQCTICNEYKHKQQKEPLMTYEIPSRPWKMVAQDLFTCNKKDYLITVDYYSDYWEVDELTNTTSQTVIECTKKHFARYGIPDVVVTDNGPQFRSQEYESFATEWKFKHPTSSPYHSQSNGKAESAVKIAKKLITKAGVDHGDLQLAILDWRNTPTDSSDKSPVQKLHSRRTRTLLPTSESLLLPEVPSNVQEIIELKRQKAKIYYDRGAKTLPDLQIGQTVRMQPHQKDNTWRKAVVVDKPGIRSYLLQTEEGHRYRRNRKSIRATSEQQLSPSQLPPAISNNQTESSLEDTMNPPTEVTGLPVETNVLTEKTSIPGEREAVGETVQLQGSTSTPETVTTTTKVTSRGREVKLPEKLKDYVRH